VVPHGEERKVTLAPRVRIHEIDPPALRMSTEIPARNRQRVVGFLAAPTGCEPSHRPSPHLGPKALPAARTLKSSRHLFSMWTPAARSGSAPDPRGEQLHTGTTWCRAAPRAKGWAPS
jgi:hypothetical protein